MNQDLKTDIIKKILDVYTHFDESSTFIQFDKRKKYFGKDVKKLTELGYYVIRINYEKKRYDIYCHHIVWYKHCGTLPDSSIYFKDGNKTNFKIENLTLDKPKNLNVKKQLIAVSEKNYAKARTLLAEHNLL